MPEMASIGQTLRQGREERGLTPEQAAFQSKVPLRLLQALESDDYHTLPDAAYLTRFLHEYARLLKLDPGPLEGEFRKAIRRPPGTFTAVAPPPAPPPAIPWKQVLWTAAAILVVIPLVFLALSVASKRASDRPSPPPASPQVAEGPTEVRGPNAADQPGPSHPEGTPPGEGVVPDEASPSLSPEPESAGGAPEVPALPTSPGERTSRRFLLTARASQPTWMAVRSDHGQQREVLLQLGQTARFVADTGFVITVGNAGGVDLSLNGKPVPSLGKSGQVVRDLAIPPVRQAQDAPGTMPPAAASSQTAPSR